MSIDPKFVELTADVLEIFLSNTFTVHADESECRAVPASVHACTELARNIPQHRRASTDDMALQSATGTPMEIHTTGMPHSLVLVRTGTNYHIPGTKRKHRPAAAYTTVQQYSNIQRSSID